MCGLLYPPGGFMLAHIFPKIGSLSKYSSYNISNCIINNSSTKGLNTGILCMSVDYANHSLLVLVTPLSSLDH